MGMINLTPHVITLKFPNGAYLMVPSGKVARVIFTEPQKIRFGLIDTYTRGSHHIVAREHRFVGR